MSRTPIKEWDLNAAALLYLALWLGLSPSLSAAPVTGGTPSPAPATGGNTAKQIKEGSIEVETKGESKVRLTVGKIDPPAAFNLEDIQNFPEDRLMPVLNNTINFEEGRDFSSMMDFQDEQLIHPWLAELSQFPYLTMRTAVDKACRDWTFAVIDQAGATVAKQDGKGNPPDTITWDGSDTVRGHVAVDTVYIPQLSITDKDGYRRTYMGQPAQFSTLMYKQKGRTVIELSTKRLFLDKKAELSKEASVILDKVCDTLREEARLPFAIQPYDNDFELARSRQQTLAKYFSEKLYIPESQIVKSNPATPEKRGASMSILTNATPGSAK